MLLSPSYSKGVSSVMVVQALASKVTSPLNTRSPAVTLTQSLLLLKLFFVVSTM